MNDINHYGGVAKIIEKPIQKIFSKDLLATECRVQLPLVRKKSNIGNLICWGTVALDLINFYKVNDYVLIEGYIGFPTKKDLKQVEITAIKIYPILLDSKIILDLNSK